jgi:hypothetical protein
MLGTLTTPSFTGLLPHIFKNFFGVSAAINRVENPTGFTGKFRIRTTKHSQSKQRFYIYANKDIAN